MRMGPLIGGMCLAASCPAVAQSTARIYGSIDVGIDYVSNSAGGSLIQESAGKRSPDRLGFMSTEDMGNGNSAFVRLEMGFLSNNGKQINPNSFFNRSSYVGLQNRQLGALSLGRIPDYIYTYVGRLNNAVPGISSFYTIGNLDGLANTRALDNAVKYETVDYGGFQAGVMNSLGGRTDSFSTAREYSAGAKYENGPLKLAGAYTMSHNRSADIRGTFGITSLLGRQIQPGVPLDVYRYSTLALGASVELGRFTPHATYTQVKFEGQDDDSATMRNYQAGVNLALDRGRAYILGLSYAHTDFTDLSFNQYNLFLTHYLSKHVQLYGGAGYQHATGPEAKARQFGYAASSTANQTVARSGLNYLF